MYIDEPPKGGTNPPKGGTNPPHRFDEPPKGGMYIPSEGGMYIDEPPKGGTNPPKGGTNPPEGGSRGVVIAAPALAATTSRIYRAGIVRARCCFHG
jgi:hypothetical protein